MGEAARATACVFDVFEYNGGLDGWASTVIVKANDVDGRTYALRVTGVPWSLDLKVPYEFDETDATTLMAEIDKAIRNSFRGACPRTICACGKSQKDPQTFSTCACVQNQRLVYSKPGSTVNGYEFVRAFPYNGFQREKSRFLRVFLKQAYFSSVAKRVMIDYAKRKELGVDCEAYEFENDTVLHFIDVTARLSASTPKRETIRSDAWISFPTTRRPNQKVTRCDDEFEVDFNDLAVVQTDAPTPTPRVLCFDIETDTDGVQFSKPEVNPVYSITLYLMTSRFERVMITHGAPAPFNGVFVHTKSERDTLNEFRRRVLAFKPDIIAGHNVQGFDVEYLHRRAEILCRPDSKLDDFEYERQTELKRFRDYSFLISYDVRIFKVVRHKGGKVDPKNKNKKAAPGVANTVVYIDCPGVWVCDTLNVARERESLPDHRLDTVSREVLGDRKVEFPVSRIRKFFNGTEKMRQLLYLYNMRDSILVGQLLQTWDAVNACMKEANMFGCLVRHLHVMGKQNKLYRSFRAFGAANGVSIPKHESVSESEYAAIEDDLDFDDDEEDETPTDRRQLIPFLLNYKSAVDYSGTFAGAFVFDPEIGLHNVPVVVLDFNSLYPNIMRGHNLCSTVHLKTTTNVLENPDHLREICAKHGLDPTNDVFVAPNGDVFVKAHVKQGLGPLMMTYMLDKRGEYKRLIKRFKEAGDFVREKNAEASSNAFKIGANSFYGGTGSRLSPFYDPGVSASITKIGQNAIKAMDAYVGGSIGREWTRDGEKFTTRRIYGDTDSLMIRIENSDLISQNVFDAKRAWDLLEWLAAQVNSYGHTNNVFPSNMKMGADKVFYPYVSIAKKRYAGVLYELGKKPKTKISGLEAEKREYPEVLRRTMRTVLDMTLRSCDTKQIVEYVEMRTRNLLSADLIPEVSDEVFDALVESWDGSEENLPEVADTGESLTVSDFMMSMQIKAESDYKNAMGQPHVRAAKIWQQEMGVDAAPRPGDRVVFGYALPVDGDGKSKSASDRARPAYRFYSGKDIVDRVYYFESRYKTPLETVLNVVVGRPLTAQVLDVSRYRRLVAATRIPAIDGPKTTEPSTRLVYQTASAHKRTYAEPKKNGDVRDWLKRAKTEAEKIHS